MENDSESAWERSVRRESRRRARAEHEQRLRALTAGWMAAAEDATRRARMAEAVAELNAELDKLLASAAGGTPAGAAQ